MVSCIILPWLYNAGGLAVSIEGPSKAQLTCLDNKDGTCSASYFPTEAGEYKINVKFAEEHIAGSPFTAKITPGGMYITITVIIIIIIIFVPSVV